MNYTVTWLPSAEQDLANLWIVAKDRNKIAHAANLVDAALRKDPLSQGESREGFMRIMFEPPLGVFFEVHQSDRLVFVWAIWSIERKS